MVPLDSPHVWDTHAGAWEIMYSHGIPSLPHPPTENAQRLPCLRRQCTPAKPMTPK